MEQDPLIDTQIRDYRIQSMLGEGGMARVYKAYHIRLQREAAIKVILSEIAHDPNFQVRFEQEAQLVAKLSHPSIVLIYDFGEENGQTFLAMQYVGGGTLRQNLQSGRPIEIRRAIRYTQQMARALHHAHQHGIVHRDVKPQNMLITANDPDHLLLSDFGIAKIFDSSIEETHTGIALPAHPLTTSSGQIVGTAAYMAPEQIERHPVDARTDVYALGVVLYQMLTGNVPFQATTTSGLMYQHVHIPPKPVRQANPNIPELLASITEKALAKHPAQRFPSAEAMAIALESVLSPGSGPSSSVLNKQLPLQTTQRFVPSSSSIAPTPPTYTPQHHVYPTPPIQPPSFNPSANSPPFTPLPKPPAIHTSGTPSTPSHPATGQRLQVGGVVLIAMLVLTLVLLNWPSLHPSSPQGNPTPSPARTFADNFLTNDNGWPQEIGNGLTASIEQGHYTLITDTQETSYFPYPRAIGTLPARFTLAAEISQERGSTQVFYGLTFYLQPEHTQCYAFIVNNTGNFKVLRYNGATSQELWSGTSPAIHSGLQQKNRLQVLAQNGQFKFSINDQAVPLKPNETALADTTYATGRAGLFIAGPNTSFTVTQVQLEIS